MRYDPKVEIIHHVGPRFDEDTTHRGGFHAASVVDIAFNETFVILKHGRGLFRLTGFAWQLLVGTAVCPGVLHFLRQLLRRQPHVITRLRASMRGRLEAAAHCLGARGLSAADSRAQEGEQPGQTPLRLAIVMPSAHLHGGAEEALIHLLRNREAAKLSILMILLEEGELKKVFEDTGVPVEVIDAGRLREPWKIALAILEIRRLAKEFRADLVLGWMTKAHIYGGTAARLAGVPAIYFQMGLPDNSSVDRLSRLIPAAGALTCSDFAAKLQRSCVRHRVIGVPLAADFTRSSETAKHPPAEIRRRLGLDVDRPIVGIVGRMQRGKGIHVFVEAMVRVFQKVPDCEGVIVGDMFKFEPEFEPWLRQRIKELGMEEKIKMVGVQRNVPEWIQAMDVFVHASEREPFGIVVIEAMSLGKPVVATRPGGLEEIITHNSDGQLVTWNKADELAEAILKYLLDPEWARSVGERARQRSQEYTMEKYAHRLGEALRAILDKR